MKKYFILFGLAIVFALPVSCGNRQNAAPADSPAAADSLTVQEPLHGPDSLNDVAKIFAGIPVDSTSAYFKYTQSAEWKKHSASFDKKWALSKAGQDKVDRFAKDSLADLRARAKTVFYPFSGPDFAYPTAFFPDADTLITAALEPIGQVVSEKSLNAAYYKRCEPALSQILRLSYFITKNMQSDLGTQGLGGVTPVYEFFMARLGYEILSIDVQKQMVEIHYCKKGESHEKVLRHFMVNLKDKEIPELFTSVLDRLDPETTVGILKSCSYCMHGGSFKTIRNYMLTKTFAIVQDDTGPRYSQLLSAGYDVTLYGDYSHPLSCFSEHTYQADLDAAYKKARRRPIDFRYGYSARPQCMVSRKK